MKGIKTMKNNLFSKRISISISLFLAVGLYSLSAVLGKFSASYDLFSFPWILIYGGTLGVLFLYSMIWQLILERISLSQAYLSKGFYYGFILLWSAVIFGEFIKCNQIVGVVIITIGIIVGKTDDNR